MGKSRLTTCLMGLLVLAAFTMMGCEGKEGPAGPSGTAGTAGVSGVAGPAGPAGPAGAAGADGADGVDGELAELTCTQCHNSTNLITGKLADWEQSVHGNGGAFLYAGGRGSCAACHSGASFKDMLEAGETVDTYGVANPSSVRQDCRTCHEIHVTGTEADWALTTTDAVELFALGTTFEGGKGNLCTNCHQPRRAIADAVDGVISVTSTHWGPHHGPQSSMLVGLGGAGQDGSPMLHYSGIANTCVSCHLGEGQDHTFLPSTDACQTCHSGTEDFDINGTQTEIQEKLDTLGALLIAAGALDETGDHPVVGDYPEATAQALWNWIYIAHEDKSLGVHNPAYTRALLDAGLTALQ